MNTSYLRDLLSNLKEVLDLFVGFLFVFLGPHPQHMDVPRLGVEWELSRRPRPQPQRGRILNPLSEARDRTHVLMDASQVR